MPLCFEVQKLSQELETLGPLMDLYQAGDYAFPEHSLKWLADAEKTLSSLRVPEGAELATLRGRILKVADTFAATEGQGKRSQLQRARNAAAADALDRAETILRNRLLTAEERLRLFEEKLCEGMTALLLQTSLPEKCKPRNEWLNRVWDLLRTQPPTRPLATYLAASLGTIDRSYLLHRVLCRLDDIAIAGRRTRRRSDDSNAPSEALLPREVLSTNP